MIRPPRLFPTRRFLVAMSLGIAVGACGRARSSEPAVTPHAASRTSAPDDSKLADEIEAELFDHVLAFWFPRAVDEKRGGFVQTAKSDGTLADDGSRFLVFQARMTWVSAEVAKRYPARRNEYVGYARHGLDFLKTAFWDSKEGGLHWELDAKGEPTGREKHVYGIAFAMFAAAACQEAGVSPDAGDFAERIFDWLERHAHDAKNGGYYEALGPDGHPILTASGKADTDAIGTVHGRKSMNTHIHLLEALTELHRAAPSDQRVRERLSEVFRLVRDDIFDPAGFLQLYFAPDWTPIPTVESYGHDIETAFLLLEANEALLADTAAHARPAAANPQTTSVAERLVDRALDRGWDRHNGGFFNEGDPNGSATDKRKVWWVQAEGLNGLLAMHDLRRSETGRYGTAFRAQWDFIRAHVSDRTGGEWWGYLGESGGLDDPAQSKGDKWKACYHDGRALMVSAEKLRALATEPR